MTTLTDQAPLVQESLLTKLATARQALGLTQEEVAHRIGRSRMTVQRAEAPDASVTLSTFIELALAVNLAPGLASNDGNDEDSKWIAPEDIVHRGSQFKRTKHDLDWRDRQREAAFAKSWEAVNKHQPYGLSPVMPCLVPGHTQDQASAVATAIQWLGSEVGFDFLTRALEAAGYAVTDVQLRKT